MKALKKAALLCAAIFSFATLSIPAFAEGGGPGFSFSQGGMVNGQKQELSSSINLSNFKPESIAFLVFQVMSREDLQLGHGSLTRSPFVLPPSFLRILARFSIPRPLPAGSKPANAPDVVDLYRRAMHLYINNAFAKQNGIWSAGMGMVGSKNHNSIAWAVLPISWAVDAYRAGALDKNVYLYNLDLCEQRTDNLSKDMGNAAMIAATPQIACLVSSYLSAYGISGVPNGFLSGNLLPLVPLCLLQQGNTCGIDDAWLNGRDGLASQLMSDGSAYQAALQREIDHEPVDMHMAAMSAYARITGKEAPDTYPLPHPWIQSGTWCRAVLPGGDSNPDFTPCVLKQTQKMAEQP